MGSVGNDPAAQGAGVPEGAGALGAGDPDSSRCTGDPDAANAPATSGTPEAGVPEGGARPDGPVDCYVLFRGHTDGLALFGALRGAGVGARISPTPRAARAECGMSLLVSCEDEERIRALARTCGAHIEGMARLPRQINPDRDRYC